MFRNSSYSVVTTANTNVVPATPAQPVADRTYEIPEAFRYQNVIKMIDWDVFGNIYSCYFEPQIDTFWD